MNYFCEHCDYNVIRKDKLGGGSNGAIYPVYLQSDRSLQMVVKEVGCFFVAVKKIVEAMIKYKCSDNFQFIFNCLSVVRVRENTFFAVREKKINFGKAHGKKKTKMGKLKFKVAAALREDYRQIDQF